MAIKWKSTEKKGGDLFRGAVSWLCFLILLCTFTSGAFLLITVALDPSLAASIGDAVVRATYGDYPRWVPVAGGCLVLFFAGLLALTIAFAQERKAFETALARWLRRIWVEVKLLAIAGVLAASLFLGMFTNLGFWWAPFTAGVLVLAKNPLSGALLSAQMKQRQIRRTYLALTDGIPPERGTISAPVARMDASVITREVNFERGEAAVTHYERLAVSNGYALVELHLDTGRTHQIRVHMKYIGCPLPGDFLYHPVFDRIGRQALHSFQLEFAHPITGEPMCFLAPVPEDFRRAFLQ